MSAWSRPLRNPIPDAARLGPVPLCEGRRLSKKSGKAFREAALAEAYNRALALEKAGDLDAAATAYAEVLKLDPQDRGGAAVRLASMGRGVTPPKAPDAYVATLFDQHADAFEDILVEQLGYAVPLMLRQMLMEAAPGPYARLLDLGCGTGLSGGALRDMAAHVTGVDLSEGMVEIAFDKGTYDELYVGEAVDFLQSSDFEPWDLIVATDVLPYLGDLEPFFAGLAANTAPRAVIGFSSETLPEEIMAGSPYMVGPHQRFAHSKDYLSGRLAESGFEMLRCDDIVVRMEQGRPTPGHLVIARKR